MKTLKESTPVEHHNESLLTPDGATALDGAADFEQNISWKPAHSEQFLTTVSQ